MIVTAEALMLVAAVFVIAEIFLLAKEKISNFLEKKCKK